MNLRTVAIMGSLLVHCWICLLVTTLPSRWSLNNRTSLYRHSQTDIKEKEENERKKKEERNGNTSQKTAMTIFLAPSLCVHSFLFVFPLCSLGTEESHMPCQALPCHDSVSASASLFASGFEKRDQGPLPTIINCKMFTCMRNR